MADEIVTFGAAQGMILEQLAEATKPRIISYFPSTTGRADEAISVIVRTLDASAQVYWRPKHFELVREQYVDQETGGLRPGCETVDLVVIRSEDREATEQLCRDVFNKPPDLSIAVYETRLPQPNPYDQKHMDIAMFVPKPL